MIYLLAGTFFLICVINLRDPIKAAVAALFFLASLLNLMPPLDGISYYLLGMVPPAIIILTSIKLSKRNWSLAVCCLMAFCILANFLGMINFK